MLMWLSEFAKREKHEKRRLETREAKSPGTNLKILQRTLTRDAVVGVGWVGPPRQKEKGGKLAVISLRY